MESTLQSRVALCFAERPRATLIVVAVWPKMVLMILSVSGWPSFPCAPSVKRSKIDRPAETRARKSSSAARRRVIALPPPRPRLGLDHQRVVERGGVLEVDERKLLLELELGLGVRPLFHPDAARQEVRAVRSDAGVGHDDGRARERQRERLVDLHHRLLGSGHVGRLLGSGLLLGLRRLGCAGSNPIDRRLPLRLGPVGSAGLDRRPARGACLLPSRLGPGSGSALGDRRRLGLELCGWVGGLSWRARRGGGGLLPLAGLAGLLLVHLPPWVGLHPRVTGADSGCTMRPLGVTRM